MTAEPLQMNSKGINQFFKHRAKPVQERTPARDRQSNKDIATRTSLLQNIKIKMYIGSVGALCKCEYGPQLPRNSVKFAELTPGPRRGI
jgi:hypothetical protein